VPRKLTRRWAVGALLCALLSSGCGISGLQFTNDERLTFQEPEARRRVSLPVTVRWTMKDFTPTGLDGSTDKTKGVYAVFLDKSPMPVGKDLRWLARSDKGCQRDPRCPNTEYLKDRGVRLTTDSSITIDVLPSSPDGAGDEQHYINVVLLDGTGRRQIESAWYLPFTSKRRATG
jgi:hypothetical protein